MGWKGTVRSINSAYKRGVREYEREERRRQKDLDRRQKEAIKMEALAQAAYEFECFENLIDRLTSVHKEPVEKIDWKQIADTPSPLEPVKDTSHEEKAKNALKNYKPGFWDKLFKKEKKKKNKLESDITKAQDKDERFYQNALNRFRSEFDEWDESTKIARRVVAGDLSSFYEVLNEFKLFEELQDFGSVGRVEFEDIESARVIYCIKGQDVVPSEKKTLTQTGKLSVKKMPKGEFYEHFQDHVCSSALRIANELFGVLPIETVTATVMDTILNTATGHLEEQPILSVKIPRFTFEQLNLDSIDASDSMSNFIHEMKFKKTKGFEAVPQV